MQCEEASILVVDDVNAMRVYVRDLLRRAGFTKVKLAASGEEAKFMLEMEHFHLILADWRMDPTDGLALLAYVRSHPQFSTIPFVLVTGENSKESVVQAIQAGVDDYVVKPLTPLQIQNKVIGVLLRKQVAK